MQVSQMVKQGAACSDARQSQTSQQDAAEASSPRDQRHAAG